MPTGHRPWGCGHRPWAALGSERAARQARAAITGVRAGSTLTRCGTTCVCPCRSACVRALLPLAHVSRHGLPRLAFCRHSSLAWCAGEPPRPETLTNKHRTLDPQSSRSAQGATLRPVRPAGSWYILYPELPWGAPPSWEAHRFRGQTFLINWEIITTIACFYIGIKVLNPKP